MSVDTAPVIATFAELSGRRSKIIGESIRVLETNQTYIWDGDEWVVPEDFKMTGVINVATDVDLASRRWDYHGQTAITGGAVTELDGSGSAWFADTASELAPGADVIQVTGQSIGRWRKIVGLGGGGSANEIFSVDVEAALGRPGDVPRVSASQGTAATGIIDFPASSGSIPANSYIKLKTGDTTTLWRTIGITTASGGNCACSVTGPGSTGNASAATQMELVTPVTGFTGTVTFTGVSGSGADIVPGLKVIRRGTPAINSPSWDVTVGGTEVLGVITITISGPGLPAGAQLQLSKPRALVTQTSGVVSAGFGIQYDQGFVRAPGLVGGTDKVVRQPFSDSDDMVFKAWELPNGDPRPGITVNNQFADNAPALNALWRSLPKGATLLLGPYFYWISSPLIWSSHVLSHEGHIRINGCGAIGDGASRIIVNFVDANAPGIWFGASYCVLEDFGVQINIGARVKSGIDFSMPEGASFQSRLITENACVRVICWYTGVAAPNVGMQNGFSIGSCTVMPSNVENHTFTNCWSTGHYRAGFVTDSGQPYRTVYRECSAKNFAAQQIGIAFHNSCQSHNASIYDMDCHSQETVVFSNQEVNINVYGGQSEQCKKLFKASAGNFTPQMINFTGGRHAFTIGVGNLTLGPSAFAALDRKIIDAAGAGLLSLRGLEIQGFLADSLQCYREHGPIARDGGQWPGMTQVTWGGAITTNCREFSRGAWNQNYGSGGLGTMCPDKTGPINSQGGTITINGGTTSTAVLFSAISGTNEPDTLYDVVIGAPVASAGAAVGSTRVRSISAKATTGFTLNVEVDPSGAETVAFPFTIRRSV